jgi:selenoprotein W-related protein
VVGPSGSFDVAVDGKTVVRKHLWRFPTEEEIVKAVSKVTRKAAG